MNIFRNLIIVSIFFCVLIIISNISFADPLTFDTSLKKDGVDVSGSLAAGFDLITDRNPATFHILTLSSPTASKNLVAGYYPFFLTGSPELTTYFHSKGWPSEWVAWIDDAITGKNPFFYLKVEDNGGTQTYSIIDGFMKNVLGTETDLRINGDYPYGTYTYTGTINAVETEQLTIDVTLRIIDLTQTTTTSSTITTTIESTSSSSTTTTICTLTATPISFDSLDPGATSVNEVKSTLTANGFISSVSISGSDWTGADNMPVEQTHWSTSKDAYNTMSILSGSPVAVPVTPLQGTADVFFKLKIPDSQPHGDYQQTITFDFTCGAT